MIAQYQLLPLLPCKSESHHLLSCLCKTELSYSPQSIFLHLPLRYLGAMSFALKLDSSEQLDLKVKSFLQSLYHRGLLIQETLLRYPFSLLQWSIRSREGPSSFFFDNRVSKGSYSSLLVCRIELHHSQSHHFRAFLWRSSIVLRSHSFLLSMQLRTRR